MTSDRLEREAVLAQIEAAITEHIGVQIPGVLWTTTPVMKAIAALLPTGEGNQEVSSSRGQMSVASNGHSDAEPSGANADYAELGRACEANGLAGWWRDGDMWFQPPAEAIEAQTEARLAALSASPASPTGVSDEVPGNSSNLPTGEGCGTRSGAAQRLPSAEAGTHIPPSPPPYSLLDRGAISYEFVKQAGRLDHSADEGYAASEDPGDDRDALDSLIAFAREIMSRPLGREEEMDSSRATRGGTAQEPKSDSLEGH